MEMTSVYVQLGTLFSLMLIGYILGKINVLSKVAIEAFSKFIVKVALPCLIVSGMMITMTKENVNMAFKILGLSIIMYGITCIVAVIVAKLVTKEPSARGMYSFALVFSNCGFMGYPVFEAMFGSESIFYVAIYNIIFNILLYTLGIKLLETGKAEKQKFNVKLLINPGTVASFIGLILFFTGIRLPAFLNGAITSIGSVCTPLSMLTIGAMLSSLPLLKMFGDKSVYIVTLVRLLVLPCVLLLCLKYVLRVEELWLVAIPVIIAGMPVASNAAMMAQQYDSNPELASKTILISTLFSCVTIPLLAQIII